jgi:hypothetical protein
MPTRTVANVRDDLATALAVTGRNIYAYPPPVVIPPGVVIVPSDPYVELITIGNGGTRAKINFELIMCVAALDNQAQLDNVEQMTIEILQAVPVGFVIDPIRRPALEEVGPSNLLTIRVPVATMETLDVPIPPPPPGFSALPPLIYDPYTNEISFDDTGFAKIINTDGDVGETLYVGTIDPLYAYDPDTGDVWIEVPAP